MYDFNALDQAVIPFARVVRCSTNTPLRNSRARFGITATSRTSTATACVDL